MRLFIIGNGFDRAHDLNTQYWDFRTFLDNLYPDFLDSFEKHYNIYPNDSENYKRNLLWNCFETNLANINEDVIIEDALNIDMGLESGDYGIEETLRIYFHNEYSYIEKLAIYLKQWVKTIKIEDKSPITSQINSNNNDFYITFNYTSVLEKVYNIKPSNILHIHGSLHNDDDDPILGHGNRNRIEDIKAKRNMAQTCFNEKEISICDVIQDYYNTTFKNVRNYMHKLNKLCIYPINEIIIIGHSVDGVDLPYFKAINKITRKRAKWKVYYYNPSEKEKMQNALESQGIYPKRIEMVECCKFYDLK